MGNPILINYELLVIGMAVTVLTGTAQQALGHPSPKPVPGTEFTAITSKQTIARNVLYLLTSENKSSNISCRHIWQVCF
jgi:hypothetical protein